MKSDIVSLRVQSENLIREDGIHKAKLPIKIGWYCKKCHLFNYLDENDLCEKCKGKENGQDNM